MAIVNPVTENRVDPRGISPARIQPAEFTGGQTIGRAVAQFGQAGMSLAAQEDERHTAEARVAARDADNVATQARQALYYEGPEAFFNQRGRNALNAQTTLQAERGRIDREAAERLQGDPLAQEMYSDLSARRRVADNEQINRHLNTQRIDYENSVDQESIRVAVGQAASASHDPVEIARNLATVQEIAERRARRSGLDSAESIASARGQAAAALVGQVADRIRLRSPAEAQAFIVAHGDEIDALDLTRLLAAVDDEAAEETARDDVLPYVVTVQAEDQSRPTPANDQPGNARPTPVPGTTVMHAAIAGQESGNRERDAQGRLITSPAGAQGRMQVMPPTNADPGYGVTPARNNSDAERSRVGRDYYDALLRHYGGNVVLALTAYNWGPGNVDAHIRAHGDPRTGRISDSAWLATIPNSEAQNYAPAVLRRAGTRPATSPASPSAQAPTYAGEEINLAATINRIESDPELTYARKQALIRAATQMHGLGQQARQEADQRLADLAYEQMNRLGDNYTRYDQLPLTVRQQLAANPRLEYQFRQIAQTNLEAQQREAAAGPPAGSSQFFDLLETSQGTPGERSAFMRIDLRSPQYNITHGERAELIRLQGSYRREGERDAAGQPQREGVNIDRVRTYVARVATEGGFQPSRGNRMSADQRSNFLLLTQRVIDRARAEQSRLNRQLTDEELQTIVATEVRPVTVVTRGATGERRTALPNYRARPFAETHRGDYVLTETNVPAGVPPRDASAIIEAYRRENAGARPTDEMIAAIYSRRAP